MHRGMLWPQRAPGKQRSDDCLRMMIVAMVDCSARELVCVVLCCFVLTSKNETMCLHGKNIHAVLTQTLAHIPSTCPKRTIDH